MKTKWNLLVVLALVMSLVGVPTAQVQAADVTLMEQLPSTTGVYGITPADSTFCSGINNCRKADNFRVSGGGMIIHQVELWGAYAPDDTAVYPDNFTVVFYQDNAGLPGTAIHTQNSVASVREATGRTKAGISAEYHYTLTLAEPQTLAPGTYWIEITNTGGTPNPGGIDKLFAWEGTNRSDPGGMSLLPYASYSSSGGWEISTEYNYMTLRLIGTEVPLTYTISGYVFRDRNKDGMRDLYDWPINLNWAVYLNQGCDSSIDQSTNTTLAGYYEFTNLPEGQCYRLSEETRTGWVPYTTLNDITLTGNVSQDIGNWYPDFHVEPEDVPAGDVDVAYSLQYTTHYYPDVPAFGTSPYTFALINNYDGTPSILPVGLTLLEGGLLSGTPTEAGVFEITVQATDANGALSDPRDQDLVISQDGSFDLTSSANPSLEGQAVTFTFSGTGDLVFQNGTPMPPIGSVTFLDNNVPITGCEDLYLNIAYDENGMGVFGNYPATCTTADLGIGTHTIRAVFTDIGAGFYHNAEATLNQQVVQSLPILEQLPNQATATVSAFDICAHVGSDGACLAAENFVVPEGETRTIGEIQLWGTFLDYSNGTAVNPTADSYTVIFYHPDTSGLPGEGFHTETALTPVRVATGVDIVLTSQPFPEYKISLTLAKPQTLTAGSYWIEIAEETTQSPVVFAWETGSADTYGLGQDNWAGMINAAWQLMPPSSDTDPNWYNLALRLIEPEPDVDLDLTFGTGGRVDTGVSDFANMLFFPAPSVQQSDGSILVGGFDLSGGNPQALLERYTVDGELDVSFNNDGSLSPQVTGSTASIIAGTHIGSQDEILAVGGYAVNESLDGLFLARYDSAGVPVADFGTDGILPVTLPEGWTGAMPMGSALQSDGKLLITGFTVQGPNQVGFLMRLDPADGTLDTTFGSGGVVLNLAPGQVTLQSDGKILVSSPPDWSPFTIYRFTAAGALDTSFDTDGKLEIPASFMCSAVAEGQEGKLYFTGGPIGISDTTQSNFFLARLNADGSPDLTFGGGNGSVFTDFAGGEDQSCSLLVQADGKVIVGGGATSADGSQGAALVRYSAEGELKIFTAADFPTLITQLALTPAGKLLATGMTYDQDTGSSWTSLLRYDLGMAVPTHTVSGMVFDDSNNNGSQDTGTGPGEMEEGLPNVTVVADAGCDGDFAAEVWTQTATDGTFSLGVPEGGPTCIVPDLDATQVQTTTDYRIDSLSADVSGVLIGVHKLTLQFDPPEFPVAELNQPYNNASMTVAAGSGVPPYTFNASNMDWVAPGLTLEFDPDTGTLTYSGTPTNLGEFGADYSVTDSRGVKGWPSLGVMVKTQAASSQLTSSANPAVSGTSLTFTFTVIGIEGYAPNGHVTFKDDGAVIPGCEYMDVDATGTATCSAGVLSDGLHTIGAEYMYDSYYFDWSSTLDQVVAAATLDHFFILPEPSLAGYPMMGLYVDFTGTVNNNAGQVPVPYTCKVNYGDGTVENGDLMSRDGAYIYACYGNEMYTYNSAGTYTITFTINDLTGNKLIDFTTQHTVINDPDPGYITVTPSPAYVNQPVTFTATADGYAYYEWMVVGQDTYFGYAQTASTTFPEAGTYKVILIAIKYDTATMLPIVLEDVVEVTVIPSSSADLSLTKTDSKDPVKPGAQLVYMLTVKNLGPNEAVSVSVVDTLDRDTTYVSFSAPKGWRCQHASGKVTCTKASLASGSSGTIKITVTVSKNAKVGKELVNNATVSSTTYDPDLLNNTVVQKTLVSK